MSSSLVAKRNKQLKPEEQSGMPFLMAIPLLCNVSNYQGSFRGGTRGNAVPIVENLSERMGTVFPLLKCLRTHNNSPQVEKENKNGLRLLPYGKPRAVCSVDSYENH